MVQSLLDLLCSQLKNLLSQAGVMPSFGEEEEDGKADLTGESERKDQRGMINKIKNASYCLNEMHNSRCAVFCEK